MEDFCSQNCAELQWSDEVFDEAECEECFQACLAHYAEPEPFFQ